MAARKHITPYVAGHAVDHSISDGTIKRTGLTASIAHETLRLEIKQGSATVQILAKDWDFFKKQADELLSKRRLLDSATK